MCGAIVPKLFPTLAPDARVIAYGIQDPEPAAITNGMLIYSNLIWRSFGIDRWLSQHTSRELAEMREELWTMIRAGILKLPVNSTFRSIVSTERWLQTIPRGAKARFFSFKEPY